jgi:hypothetical protein
MPPAVAAFSAPAGKFLIGGVTGGGGKAAGLRGQNRENGQEEDGESHELHHEKEIVWNKPFLYMNGLLNFVCKRAARRALRRVARRPSPPRRRRMNRDGATWPQRSS